MPKTVPITRMLVQNGNPYKAANPMKPVGCVMHDTAANNSAMTEAARIINLAHAYSSMQFYCDYERAVQVVDTNWNAWHATDGVSGFANRNLIGIETCWTHPTDAHFNRTNYLACSDNACWIAALMHVQYGWGKAVLGFKDGGKWKGTVFMHQWFAATACPYRSKPRFNEVISNINKYIDEIKGNVGGTETVIPFEPTKNINMWVGPLTGGDYTACKSLLVELATISENGGIITTTSGLNANDQMKVADFIISKQLNKLYGIVYPTGDCSAIQAQLDAANATIAQQQQTIAEKDSTIGIQSGKIDAKNAALGQIKSLSEQAIV